MAFVVAACGSSTATSTVFLPRATIPNVPTATPSAAPAAPALPGGHLGEALAIAGPLPREVSFTDWAAIRQAADVEALTGASPFEDKARAIRNDMTLAGFGLRYLRTQASDWGFDVFDLDWEARVSVPGDAVWLLRLRDGYDLSLLSGLLDERGYATEALAHGVLRSLAKSEFLALAPRSLVQSPEFRNAGITDDGQTLVLSAIKPDTVRSILTDGPQPVADLSVRSVAGLLERPLAAVLQVGNMCDAAELVIAPVLDNRAFVALLQRAGTLHAYNALGIGYSRQPEPRGRIVLGYAIADDAAADLAGRQLLADEGLSFSGVPYRRNSFSLTDARVEDRAIVLDVGPPEAVIPTTNADSFGPTEIFPRGLMVVALNRDYLFGVCSR